MSGRLCLGLASIARFNGFSQVLNWWKVAGAFDVDRTAGANLVGKDAWDAGYFDLETGEILAPVPADVVSFSRMFYAAPGAGNLAAGHDYSGMQWTVKWDGRGANLTFAGLTSGSSSSIDNANGTATCTFGSNPGNTTVTFTITNANDPPTNIRIYQTMYASNVNAGEVFNPDWIAEIAQFKTLRLMELQATNNLDLEDFDQYSSLEYPHWGQLLLPTSATGPRGSFPPEIMCELASATGCELHICIPHKATDACVLALAQYMRDNCPTTVTWEYSNECWNFVFSQTTYCLNQGEAIWGSGDGARYSKWYGYRAAQCMKIIRDAYNNRSRWRGCLATQTVSTTVTNNALIGVNHFIDNEAPSLEVADLFDDLAVTGYFGDVILTTQPSAVTKANPGVVTSNGHGYSNGTRVRLFVATGMTQLNDVTAVVANSTTNTYELQGIDTSGFSDWVNANTNYVVRATLFDLMDDSEAHHDDDAEAYPTDYSFFNQVLADALRNGSSAWTGDQGGTLTFSVHLANLVSTHWPAQKTIADANGLRLTQYEGGNHFVGAGGLTVGSGNSRFNTYLFESGYSADIAAVYAAGFSAFLLLGGQLPSKFVEGGTCSPAGTWSGMRIIPGDEDNPVWVKTRNANDGVYPHQIGLVMVDA
jgi:hypothetical protein